MEKDLKDILRVLKKRLNIILPITIFCTLLAAILSFYVIKPTYEAKTSIIIGKVGDDNKNVQFNDVLMYQNLLKTYGEIAQSKSVAESAINKLDKPITIDELQNATTITPEPNTQILVIKVRSKNPQESLDMVNAVSSSFIDESLKLYPSGNVQIMDKADVPTEPVSPNKKLNISIAFILGIMLSSGIVMILEYIDNTIKTEEDVDRYLGIPVIGIIPKYNEEI